ncbi:hypothetical protein [Pelotomaculum propionicicum]|uniref:Uncharacterized protein n=1 Tax=Pelotomaculum propionicicum TaxID=258475 RepID=A0A4Y7RUJ7_9FIRM|nr:hypothetical protein [Pelotomaculum propionicicum]NLI14135.1 hypothetical protein [Peptococcaceae bacterium]TEB12362.1 hypothetical protein Pmgp_00979 [Pelotomaculum propionicicum]
MKAKQPQQQSELVKSLASTIHKKMVAPSADKMDSFNREISEISQKAAALEHNLTQLAAAHGKTRSIAVFAAAGAVLLGLALVCLVFLRI